MRDNHDKMPEIVDAFEKDGQYFGVVGLTIDRSTKRYQFGVSRAGYLALKRTLQLRPFDTMPGLEQRYFFAGYGALNRSKFTVRVRVEQSDQGKGVDVRLPKDLLANLRWFSELKEHDEAAHLPEYAVPVRSQN